jgi:hypothetical protein
MSGETGAMAHRIPAHKKLQRSPRILPRARGTQGSLVHGRPRAPPPSYTPGSQGFAGDPV